MLRCSCSTAASYLAFGTLQFSGSLRVNDALYPSKSGLINKHTVKHTVPVKCLKENMLPEKNVTYRFEQTYRETYRWPILGCECNAVASYLGFETFCGSLRVNVPCARLSPD
jgi:hypothetical protein